MGAFSGKFMGDPGLYTFQQVIDKVAEALDRVDADKANTDMPVQIEVTIRGPGTVETIVVPTDSVREVVAILKLNAS